MSRYRNNHYVPIWYQERFIPANARERKFFYLDLAPEVKVNNGHRYTREAIKRWGPISCFAEQDLYTTKFGDKLSTEIEEKFFGPLDATANIALDYLTNFAHPSVDREAFYLFLSYVSIQKLRTPKGLLYLSNLTNISNGNPLLRALQELQNLFCAIWTEAVWSIVDAGDSEVGFIISDHPVTVYNSGCFPGSKWCREGLDPHIWQSGTHTIFPLTPRRALVLTNLSWVRYPYGNPLKDRPNPKPLREAMFKFTDIQTGRILSSQEVLQINYIIKKRALRYIAAPERGWLFPEAQLQNPQWDKFGTDYLLMPDPRSVPFSSQIIIGHRDGSSSRFDEYGRRPWDPEFNEDPDGFEFETFDAFQGEYARRFGPVRRGQAYSLGRIITEDTPEFHAYHLALEARNRKHRYR